MAQPFIESEPVYVVASEMGTRASSSAEAVSEGSAFPGGSAAWTTALESLVLSPEIEVEWAAAGVTGDDEDDEAQRRRWVEVSIGLLGGLGDMTPLGPSIPARLKAAAATAEDEEEEGEGAGILRASEVVHLVPVPAAVATAAALEAARARAVVVADHLGLTGLVRIDAFMNVDSGELAVLGVETLPDLSAGSPLYAQVRRGGGMPRSIPLVFLTMIFLFPLLPPWMLV